jgi:hypothetical protein
MVKQLHTYYNKITFQFLNQIFSKACCKRFKFSAVLIVFSANFVLNFISKSFHFNKVLAHLIHIVNHHLAHIFFISDMNEFISKLELELLFKFASISFDSDILLLFFTSQKISFITSFETKVSFLIS